MTTKDKFKNLSPAMQIIQKAQGESEKPDNKTVAKRQSLTPPPGHKINPIFIETKTKRLQLLMQPSLYGDVKKAADIAGVSVNEIVHILLKEAIDARA